MSVTTAAGTCPYSGIDFTDPDLIERGMPVREFAELRRTAPVHWNAQPAYKAIFGDDGFWAITRHRDIQGRSPRLRTVVHQRQGAPSSGCLST